MKTRRLHVHAHCGTDTRSQAKCSGLTAAHSKAAKDALACAVIVGDCS